MSLKEHLLKVKRRTITIDELESFAKHCRSYEAFANEVLELEQKNLLVMVKAQGRNTRKPSLAHQYRINKHALNRNYHQQLQSYRMKFSNAIDLDAYFMLDAADFQADLPYLEQINDYIEKNGLPSERVPAPERSFALFGNEKFIEKEGRKILSRVNLWEKMDIFPVDDPIMFAIHPERVGQQNQLHLIVENKTTYQALLPALCHTSFSTLIYGQGHKITKSVENFSDQYPVEASHRFLYFGDMDRSGIMIWHRLSKKMGGITPALPFYKACLRKKQAYGKTNQTAERDALLCFQSFFSLETQAQIEHMLKEGAYYPQEVLKTQELQSIITQTDWANYL